MAVINIDSSFISWILTPQEISQGAILTSLQKQVVQNIIHQKAEEKLNLTFIPENLQREAELQGWILALKSLLDNSSDAEKELITSIQSSNSQEP